MRQVHLFSTCRPTRHGRAGTRGCAEVKVAGVDQFQAGSAVAAAGVRCVEPLEGAAALACGRRTRHRRADAGGALAASARGWPRRHRPPRACAARQASKSREDASAQRREERGSADRRGRSVAQARRRIRRVRRRGRDVDAEADDDGEAVRRGSRAPSSRMPASLAPSSRRSFGHLSARRGAPMRRERAATASCRASAGDEAELRRERRRRTGRSAAGWRRDCPAATPRCGPCRPLPARLLARDDPEPRRDRPARAARERLVVGRADAVADVDEPVAGRRSVAEPTDRTSEQRARRRRAAAPTSGRRHEPEAGRRQTLDERRARPSAPARIGSKRRRRLVEIHDLDDAQVVVGADHAGHNADHGERVRGAPRSPRRRRRTWRRSRRAAECRPARTSASRGRRPCPAGCATGRRDRRCSRPCSSSRRIARMQAKVPSVMTR